MNRTGHEMQEAACSALASLDETGRKPNYTKRGALR